MKQFKTRRQFSCFLKFLEYTNYVTAGNCLVRFPNIYIYILKTARLPLLEIWHACLQHSCSLYIIYYCMAVTPRIIDMMHTFFLFYNVSKLLNIVHHPNNYISLRNITTKVCQCHKLKT